MMEKEILKEKIMMWFRIIVTISVMTILLFLFITNTYPAKTLGEKESAGRDAYFMDEFDNYSRYSTPIFNGQINNLSRWKDGGTITLWLDIKNSSALDRVDLKLVDDKGNSKIFTGIENLHLASSENKIKSDDPFPDIVFVDNQTNDKWQDYLLVDGTNFLFYQFNSTGSLDMENIVGYELIMNGTSDISLIEDLRMQDGLTRYKNPTDGVWYAPNGLPQYGVYWPDDGRMVIKNVRQTQYPSNGDHSRMISSIGTPKDFVMSVRFNITHLPPQAERINTFLRIAWDFENVWDPGHDQTIAYFSFEWNKFGLQRVYPIERYFQQGYEPATGSKDAMTNAEIIPGHTYQVDIEVEGQKARAVLYEVLKHRYKKIAQTRYTFEMPRPEKSYPFSLEFTGNVEGAIDFIKVYEID